MREQTTLRGISCIKETFYSLFNNNKIDSNFMKKKNTKYLFHDKIRMKAFRTTSKKERHHDHKYLNLHRHQ